MHDLLKIQNQCYKAYQKKAFYGAHYPTRYQHADNVFLQLLLLALAISGFFLRVQKRTFFYV